MKKQKTLLIVVLLVAIVMVGIYVAMGLMDKGTDKEKETTKITEDTNVMIIDLVDVIYVQYTNPDSTVTLIKEGELWTSEEQPELVLAKDFVEDRVESLSQIEGTLVKDAKKEDCGLEEPMYTLVVENEKESVKLLIGCSEDGNYYAMVDGMKDIYSIKQSVVYLLDLSAEGYSDSDDDMYDYYLNMGLENEGTDQDQMVEEDDDSLIEEEPDEGAEDGDELITPDDEEIDDTVTEE